MPLQKIRARCHSNSYPTCLNWHGEQAINQKGLVEVNGYEPAAHTHPATATTRYSDHGGGERIRTDGLLRARQALSQLSYTPEKAQ